MFGYDWPRFHAAVNDLPTALLLVTVLFDLGAWLTKRDSLKSAALWTLWAGVIGGWVAVLAGLQAEEAIEHGEAIHELMETHETLALTTMGIFTAVLAWKLFRRSKLTGAEEAGLRVLSLAGLVTIVWTAVLGGKLMFEHAAGSPTPSCSGKWRTERRGITTRRARSRNMSTRSPPTRPSAPGTRIPPAHQRINTDAERGTRNAEPRGRSRCA